MLALISLPFVLPLYIWFAVRTDNVLLMIGLAIGLWGGMWLDDKRKVRRRRRSQETQRAQL